MTRFVLVFSIFYSIFAFYGFQAIKTIFKSQWVHIAYVALFLLTLGYFIFKITNYAPGSAMRSSTAISAGIVFSFLALALVLSFILFFEDIFRVGEYIVHKMFGAKAAIEGDIMPSRRKFISSIALGLASLPFGALLYGMYKGKYNYKVLKYTLEYDDLPDAFDGYQITQISDVHSGSFDNADKVAYGIDLINKQKSDVLLFTGDMVNNEAAEMEPWKELFSKLEAKDGKFSVLGNHDYGDYKEWHHEKAENDRLKKENVNALMKLQKDMGFDLLLNESRFIEKDGERIALVGVENWGKGGFKKSGDLQKAKAEIDKNDFKIVLSHDPSHWEAEVIPDAYHYHLTLSGHTHGMQFGIEIPGWFKWSPVKWRYKQWAGIYKEKGQFINVNRGFGFIGYPGRFGIWPEITVITLKKKSLT
jgi:predicted MPP superfamily phosphohydrolase